LKFGEIGYKEDKNGQVDLSTVTCMTCNFMSLWPFLENCIKQGYEKDVENVLKKAAKNFEHNYNHRLVRRALKKV
jgi:hypothetical protein